VANRAREGIAWGNALARRLGHKIARTYSLWCAREDAHRWRLVIPSGAWVCQRCPHVSFDFARFNEHYLTAHAI
jgi:hypothetical protein